MARRPVKPLPNGRVGSSPTPPTKYKVEKAAMNHTGEVSETSFVFYAPVAQLDRATAFIWECLKGNFQSRTLQIR